MSYATDVSPLVFDLETAAHPEARDYIDPPDLSKITAPANYKDPEKIAAYIAQAKVDAVAEYDRDVAEGSALDWNVGRIVALGWWTERVGIEVHPLRDELDEAQALQAFWSLAKHRTLVGFNILGFDCRYLIQRSRLLGIGYPVLDLGKYGRGGIRDLYMELTFNEGKYDKGCMRRSLRAFAKRFGVPVNDSTNGADIPALVAAGEWEAVANHCAADVDLTVALAKKLGVIQASALEVAI